MSRAPDLADDAVFDRFYRENVRTVLRWVIRLGGPLLDAEDVTQDVFGVAYRKAHTFREGSPTAWLYGITRRVVANARRRARFRQFVGLHLLPGIPSPGPTMDARLEKLGRRRIVQTALDALGEKHREAIVLVDLEERTAVEAAAMIGVSVGTLYSRLHHARKAFAVALAPYEADLAQATRRVHLKGEA
ncbi:MAG: RNA polymerase sigma factor [Alphaproteobacteria bacterium]|nr:RNA polymerase sigma factor [Alphaproteobacteria bacterium]